jgi:formylglycine-generating enzyme required for sulfatase activity
MRVLPVRALSALVALLFASSASAVTMDWTPVGNMGNACDPQSQGCFGEVGYAYSIGTYEVTNAQYTEFLNAKAASDPFGLYNTDMGITSFTPAAITRSGSSGSYTYVAVAGRGDMPVGYVSFFDALRFANWMNNGQGTGDTETGAYTLLGGTATPSNSATVTRNAGAAIVLTSENEWYKAAYYDAQSASYFDYPSRSDTTTTCTAPTASPNSANCGYVMQDYTIVGIYSGSASPYGTFDQGGNVWEWNEAIILSSAERGTRGGNYSFGPSSLAAIARDENPPTYESGLGFRLAYIPEPTTGLLVTFGLLGLGIRRRARN